MLLNRLVQLNNKDRPSVIEQTVHTFNDLLLGQVQIHQGSSTTVSDAFEKLLVFPDERVINWLELTEEVAQIGV